MTFKDTDFRLGKQMEEFDLNFLGFCWKNENGNFGLGDEARSLQNLSWGKVGSSLDAFDYVYGWIRMKRS